jgi:hypothetical protein
MEKKKPSELMVGEFLIKNRIITKAQLQSSLELQKYNTDRLVGEILVTQGVLTKEDLIMALEMYMLVTGKKPIHVDEWLDQEEIDMLIEKIQKK